MTALDFPDASFDAIVSYYATIHVPRDEHQHLLGNFRCTLKPASMALLRMGLGDLPGELEVNWFGTKMHFSHFDGQANLRMLS
jgi:hypothetical protein